MTNTTVIGHLIRNTGKDGARPWHGGTIDPKRLLNVSISRDSAQFALHQSGQFQLCPECVTAHDEVIARRWQKEREAEQRCQEAAQKRIARDKEKRDIIRTVTGRNDIAPDDLEIELVTAYRDGKDYLIFLEAMKALDDAALQHVGLTSWGEGDGSN